MLKIKKIKIDIFYPILFTAAFTLIGLVTLCLLGVYGYDTGPDVDYTHHEPIRECLYIGIPVLFFMAGYVWSLFLIENPIKRKYFDKSGFAWEKCPYICWIIKSCIEAICVGFVPIVFILIVILKYIGVILAGIGYILWMIVQTIGVIFTIPDGKAESKIKQIWSK